MRKAVLTRLDSLDYAGTESLNTICSNLSFSGHQIKKIILTSASAGQGKSFLTMQILRNFARRGKRAVLVDTDLRRSYFIKRFGFKTEGEVLGLTHYLAGFCDVNQVLYQTNIPGAYVIPAGRDVSNPIPLLDSPQFGALMDQLAESFDVVLVDAPPIGLVIDAAEVAKHCDGTVFVVEYNVTHRRELQEAQRQINQAGSPILGCIINKVSLDTYSAKKYYSKSYYSNHYEGDGGESLTSHGKKKRS